MSAQQYRAVLGVPSYRWATVTSVNPLRIQLDAPDTAPLPFTPDSLIPLSELTVGVRVWVQLTQPADMTAQRYALIVGSGGGGDTGWITPTFQNAWVNYGSPYAPAGYRMLGGVLYLRGLVKSGTVSTDQTATSPATIFTLPAQYRPAYQMMLVTYSNNAIGRCDVMATTGQVLAVAGSNVWFNLSGLSVPLG